MKSGAEKKAPDAKPASSKAPVPQQDESALEFQPADLSRLGPQHVIALQRMVGNQAVQQLLRRKAVGPQLGAPQTSLMHKQPTVARPQPLEQPPLENEIDRFDPASAESNERVQRAIAKLPGKSSGWFRKGHRDKINLMVEAYNVLEIKSSGSKRTVASYQKLIPEIQKIWQAAHTWQIDVMKDNPEKAATIAEWMTNEVEREEASKNAQIGDLQEAANLKNSWDTAGYDARFTTPDYTDQNAGAGARWLATPELAPVYKYFLIQVQYEASSLYAFEDVKKYRASPSRAEALRIYNKYEMGTSNQLNITGEHAGGIDAVNAVRATITGLEADENAAPPANFGAIEVSLTKIVNELFIAFKTTEPFKRVTTPPAR